MFPSHDRGGVVFSDNGSSPDTISHTTTLSWIDLNFRRGMQVSVSGSSLNDGNYTINQITDSTLTLADTDSLFDEVDTVSNILFQGTLVVLNLPEAQTFGAAAEHNFGAGILLLCWNFLDDGGTVRLVGHDAARLTECTA